MPWTGLATVSTMALAWLLYQYGPTLLQYFTGAEEDTSVQRHAIPGASLRSRPVIGAVPVQRTPPSGATAVVQRLGIETKNRIWTEVTSVQVLREGVYVVRKDENEALVVKTAADMEDPLFEAVGAHAGKMLGANTVRTEALPIASEEIQQALHHFSTLGDTGQQLVQAIRTSRHEHLLVMPYVAGKDLKDAAEDWTNAGLDRQKGWMKEIGKIWLLDLVIQNPDRHAENLRLGTDGKLHAIDQVVGPMATNEFGGEKVAQLLSDLPRAKERFFQKLNSDLEGFELSWEDFAESFDDGVREVRARLEGVTSKDFSAIFDMLAGAKRNVALPGIEAALPEIRDRIPL